MRNKTKTLRLFLSLLVASSFLIACGNPEGDFKEAEHTNSEQAFGEFIGKHPNSPLVAKAKKRIENIAYEQAKRSGTSTGYDEFLKRFPASLLSQQATADLQRVAYDETKRASTTSCIRSIFGTLSQD